MKKNKEKFRFIQKLTLSLHYQITHIKITTMKTLFVIIALFISTFSFGQVYNLENFGDYKMSEDKNFDFWYYVKEDTIYRADQAIWFSVLKPSDALSHLLTREQACEVFDKTDTDSLDKEFKLNPKAFIDFHRAKLSFFWSELRALGDVKIYDHYSQHRKLLTTSQVSTLQSIYYHDLVLAIYAPFGRIRNNF